MSASPVSPLSFKILAECSVSKARTALMTLPHHTVETPVFMPVGTQGTLKGLLPDQLVAMECQIMLGNTYHLGTRPGPEVLKKAGGLHKFMGWERALLTDSGGFQMVSLLELAEITEDGVKFKSPFDGSNCLLTPERSIEIQNAIGADIIMQLDDVVSVLTKGPRVEEAMERTTRWLERCLKAHRRPSDQNVFPIVQGGLDLRLRERSAGMQTAATGSTGGFAIGGLSGGEAKDDFWRVTGACASLLPRESPHYSMGVGHAVDLVVCVALGVDMFDCVFPTRTARFGCGLTEFGQINLKQKQFEKDFRPIMEGCGCSTCKRYTRAYIHGIVTREPVSCHLLTAHNVYYQLSLMKSIREAIKEDRFPAFVEDFVRAMYPTGNVPRWVSEALGSVGISVKSTNSSSPLAETTEQEAVITS